MKPLVSCVLAAVLLVIAPSVQAQTRLPKPVITRPTVLAGPAKLSAYVTKGKVTLTFSPVGGAIAYRVTRSFTGSDPVRGGEVTIHEGSAPGYFDPDNRGLCLATIPQGYCEYVDTKVVQSIVYTYRVWAIVQGPMLSQPSPGATVAAR